MDHPSAGSGAGRRGGPFPRYLVLTATALLALTAYLWVQMPDFRPNILAEAIGALTTVLIIDRLIHHRRRMRWREVEEKVRHALSDKVGVIFTDIASLLGLGSGALERPGPPLAGEEGALPKSQLEEMRKLAASDDGAVRSKLRASFPESGSYHHFEQYWKALSDFQIKYEDFLEPGEVSLLIDLQTHLQNLYLNLGLLQKQRERGGHVDAALMPETEARVVRQAHQVLRTLVGMLDSRMWVPG